MTAGVLLPGVVTCAQAQSYPTKPIRIIVPFAPAGAVDQLLRPLQPSLAEILGQSVVIDNRPGGGGVIGTELAAKSAADGYTLLAVTSSFAVNPSLQSNLPYDTVRDFAPISILASQPNILAVHADVPVRTVKELIALAKAKPGSLNFASGGNGSSPHLTGELFKMLTGTQITHVPFKGTAPALVEVMGGRIEILFAGPLAIERALSGRLRALAVASAQRTPLLPDVPTMQEAGLPGLETGSWFGLLAPARTPGAVVNRLYTAFRDAMQRPDMKSRLTAQGVDIIADNPQRSAAFISKEIGQWTTVVKAANIRIQ